MPVALPQAKSVKNPRNSTPFPENAPFEEDSPLGPDIELEDACLPHFDQTLLSHLPKVIADAVASACDETEYDILLLAALNSLSTVMPNVTGMLKTDVYEPPYYTLIIAFVRRPSMGMLAIGTPGMFMQLIPSTESGSTEKNVEIMDEDYDIAFHIGTCCLKHSLFASTSLKHSNTTLHHKMPTVQIELFADMPDKFKTADILAEAFVRGISRSSIFRMLKKAQQYGLLTSERAGCYEKTDEGKKITNPRKG